MLAVFGTWNQSTHKSLVIIYYMQGRNGAGCGKQRGLFPKENVGSIREDQNTSGYELKLCVSYARNECGYSSPSEFV